MRFMITTARDPNAPKTEGAPPPSEEVIAAYMKFNEDLTKAGVLVTSEGVNPSRPTTRLGVKDGKRVVLDGPFVETKELIGGFYLIDVASQEEAIAWALRCPTGIGHHDQLTVVPMTGADDLSPKMMDLISRVAPTWMKSFSGKK